MPSRMRQCLSFFNRASRRPNATKNIHSSRIDIPGPRAVSGSGDLGGGAENRTKNGTKKPGIGCMAGTLREEGKKREKQRTTRSRGKGGGRDQRASSSTGDGRGAQRDLAGEMWSRQPIRKMHACLSGFKSSPKREKRET